MAQILIVHQNFPAQYKHIAPALVRAGHDVRATNLRTQEQPGERTPDTPEQWHGVAVFPYAVAHARTPQQHPWLGWLEGQVLRGQACFQALQHMRDQGYTPDVVLAHIGWGEALFIKEVWPHARLALYGEFYYQTQGGDVGFDPEFPMDSDDAMCKLRLRNASQLLQLQAADVVIAPTHWQASTFPQAYQDRIQVIHDGIDTQALAPGTHTRVQLPNGQQVQTGDEVVTFVSRNLEPYRGYHSFMRALPALLRERPNAQVLIIGGDGVGYGQAAPAGQTWKHIFANETLPQLTATQRARVHFLGKLPYASYLAVMRLCAVHVYLTYPFVLSWSLLEAMSLGCAIVGSDTPPVREVISHGNTGHLVDFFDPAALAHAIAGLLANPSARQQLGQSAHALVRQRYDLNSVCMPQHMQWIERLL